MFLGPSLSYLRFYLMSVDDQGFLILIELCRYIGDHNGAYDNTGYGVRSVIVGMGGSSVGLDCWNLFPNHLLTHNFVYFSSSC